MAFKRTGAKALLNNNQARFSTAYKFSKKANFEVGKDAYIIPLGLESGFFETPCHRILPHKVDGKLIGFNNTTFTTYIKCKGIDEEGNKSESLCCTLAQLEKDRIPDKEEAGKRIVSFTTFRVHLPVLILGNSLGDKNKGTYPISKVSILNDLRSESGLNFAFIEMASSSFRNDIVLAYGKKLKEEGVIDYEMEENSEEFLNEVLQRLSKTIIKVHGVSKAGFQAALKEYSFFPFDNPAIATGSPAGEKEAIIGYRDNQEIQNKICEFLDLFNIEVDNMFNDWSEKDLQEYYNSAIGVDLKTPIAQPKSKGTDEDEEVVEEVEQPKATSTPKYVDEDGNEAEPASDDEIEALLNNPCGAAEEQPASDDSLEAFEVGMDEEDDFFGEE